MGHEFKFFHPTLVFTRQFNCSFVSFMGLINPFSIKELKMEKGTKARAEFVKARVVVVDPNLAMPTPFLLRYQDSFSNKKKKNKKFPNQESIWSRRSLFKRDFPSNSYCDQSKSLWCYHQC